MEARSTSPDGQDRASRLSDLGLLLVLLALATSLRAWTITHTEVTARDSIGFIRYALQLEEQPLTSVLRANHQHPGYATLILAVSWVVRSWTGALDTPTMQLSAQLAASLAGVLLVVPMFFLGKVLFHRRVGFWAAAIFQCLPVSGRVLGDALSEGFFLFWLASALLAGVHAFQRGSWRVFGIAGLLGASAYLTRPEGAFVVGAAGLVLLVRQLSQESRQPWKRFLAQGTALTVCAVGVASPYVMVVGRLTPKPTAVKMITGESENTPGHSFSTRGEPILLASAGVPVPVSLVFADRWPEQSFPRALQGIAKEVQKGFHYVGWVPALLGLYWFRSRLRQVPGMWVLLVFFLVHALVLWWMAGVVRYVSERHVLPLVLCGVFWTAAALDDLPNRLARLRERFPTLVRWAPLALLLLFSASGLPRTLRPLHANRAGHHAAGIWLAENAHPDDEVFDPFCWAHFYAGRVFTEGKPQPAARPDSKKYIVLEPGDDLDVRQYLLGIAKRLAAQGQLVFHWPRDEPADKAQVQVFAVPRATP